jgi:uncharacterized membrane protein YkvA (DUF1232 family)
MSRNKKSRRRRWLRAAKLLPFVPLAGRAPLYARLLWALVVDPRVPVGRKLLLGLAAGYVILPFDLVPERIPVLGAIDDVAVVVLAVDAFLDGLPATIVSEKLDQLGIPRSELESDLARVRRLVPRPVRDVVAWLPGAFESVGRYIAGHDLDDRLAEMLDSVRRPHTEEEPA